MAKSGEYRNFTNQAGKSIYARIVQYDAERGRVQLELKNYKKAWVQVLDLSEADQAYIQQYNIENNKAASSEVKEKPEPVEELSKKQVKEIAEQYCEAILNKDYAAWSDLMFNTQGVSEEDFMAFYNQKKAFSFRLRYSFMPIYSEIRKIEIIDVQEYAVRIEFQTRHNSESPNDGSYFYNDLLFILPDGKIKYDMHVRHPILMASGGATQLLMHKEDFRTNGPYYDAYSNRLINSGIPLFGFDRSASASDQLESLEQIVDWIQDNGYEWDSSEPKLFFLKKLNTRLVP